MSFIIIARHPNGVIIPMCDEDDEAVEFETKGQAQECMDNHPFYSHFPSELLEVNI